MDDRRRTPSDGKSSYCLWQGLLKRKLKCEYLLAMYRINMLHYISISKFLREIISRVIFLLTEENIFFRNLPFRNKYCLWRPCLITNRDEISNLYRGTSIDASYQVLVHLAKRFQRRRFLKIGQSETRIVCGGHVC